MNVKRYHAATAREALRALKADLGADAIVLSNRAVQGGVEILALPAESVGALQSQSAPRREVQTPAKPVASARPPATTVDEDEAFTVKLNNRRPSEPAPKVVTPFQPPRYETADYMMRKRDSMPAIEAPSEQDDMGFEAYNPRARSRQPEQAAPATQSAPAIPPSPARKTPAAEVSAPSRQPLHDDFDLDAAAHMGVASRAPARQPAREDMHDDFDEPRNTRPRVMREPEPPRDDPRIADLQQSNANLMSELAGIRGMIERQLAGFAWNETQRKAPARSQIMGELLEAGFAAGLARQLVESVDESASLDEARERVRIALARDLRSMSNDADLIDRGGVYALVGPTGVGKTTTTAKIAARCVVRHGADKLAMITTDGYRIGAQEQLRIYGRILGVPVFPVRDASDLRQTLSELRDKHMVLIDTMGMSQRDHQVAEQAAMLLGAGPVRRLLLLNATARGDTLDDVIQAFGGKDLAGCILTKIDEAASLAPAVGAAIMNDLELTYVTNGQRVPEDLHLPNRTYLLHRALKGAPDTPLWQMEQDEIGMMIAAASGNSGRPGQSKSGSVRR